METTGAARPALAQQPADQRLGAGADKYRAEHSAE